jgi:hypothetical protein
MEGTLGYWIVLGVLDRNGGCCRVLENEWICAGAFGGEELRLGCLGRAVSSQRNSATPHNSNCGVIAVLHEATRNRQRCSASHHARALRSPRCRAHGATRAGRVAVCMVRMHGWRCIAATGARRLLYNASRVARFHPLHVAFAARGVLHPLRVALLRVASAPSAPSGAAIGRSPSHLSRSVTAGLALDLRFAARRAARHHGAAPPLQPELAQHNVPRRTRRVLRWSASPQGRCTASSTCCSATRPRRCAPSSRRWRTWSAGCRPPVRQRRELAVTRATGSVTVLHLARSAAHRCNTHRCSPLECNALGCNPLRCNGLTHNNDATWRCRERYGVAAAGRGASYDARQRTPSAYLRDNGHLPHNIQQRGLRVVSAFGSPPRWAVSVGRHWPVPTADLPALIPLSSA